MCILYIYIALWARRTQRVKHFAPFIGFVASSALEKSFQALKSFPVAHPSCLEPRKVSRYSDKSHQSILFSFSNMKIPIWFSQSGSKLPSSLFIFTTCVLRHRARNGKKCDYRSIFSTSSRLFRIFGNHFLPKKHIGAKHLRKKG